MESFVFNTFKEKIVNGEITANDNWRLYPVKKSFTADNEYLKYITSSYDLKTLHSGCLDKIPTLGSHLTTMHPVTYVYKPMTNTDKSDEPDYIDESNFDVFKKRYSTIDTPVDHLSALFFNLSGAYNKVDHWEDILDKYGNPTGEQKPVFKGFYYIRTAEELQWCADKVNGESEGTKLSQYNNEINIVLGDNIGLPDKKVLSYNAAKIITTPIGKYSDRPFNGIFFGNGYKFQNLLIDCGHNINGIFGIIGKYGIVAGARINGSYNTLLCKKQINLNHLKTDSCDIDAGFLCGKNYGTITECDIFGKFNISGFYPAMYSMWNKTESSGAFGHPYDNVFYPDYMCFNNLGNIIPYIGYFNEGVFASISGVKMNFNNDVGEIIPSYQQFWKTNQLLENPVGYSQDVLSTVMPSKIPEESYTANYIYSPGYWYYYITLNDTNNLTNIQPCTMQRNRANILYYDTNIVRKTLALIGQTDVLMYGNALLGDPNIGTYGLALHKSINDQNMLQNVPFNVNLPNERAYTIENMAYFQSNNFAYAKYAQWLDKSIKLNIQSRAAYCVSPVAGFNCGKILNSNIVVETITRDTFVGFMGGLAGKGSDGQINNVNCLHAYNDSTGDDAIFKCGNYNALLTRSIYDTRNEKQYHASLNDGINVFQEYLFPKKSIKNIGGLFGSYVIGTLNSLGIANTDVVFYNNTVVPLNRDLNWVVDIMENQYDYWFANRFGTVAAIAEFNTSNIIQYISTDNKEEKLHAGLFINCRFAYSQPDMNIYDTPWSLRYNQSLCEKVSGDTYNYGVASPFIAEIKPVYNATPSIISTMNTNSVSAKGMLLKNYTALSHSSLYSVDSPFMHETESGRIGIFTVDQNFATPVDDPLFYSINCECDLPLVINGGITNEDNKNVVDRVSNTACESFDLDIQTIPSKIFGFENVTIEAEGLSSGALFSTVTVPAAAKIAPVNQELLNTDYGYRFGTYYGNKYPTTYPYFGSDISLIPTVNDETSEIMTLDVRLQNIVNITPAGGGIDGSTIGSKICVPGTKVEKIVHGLYKDLYIEAFLPYMGNDDALTGKYEYNVEDKYERGFAFRYVTFNPNEYSTIDEVKQSIANNAELADDVKNDDLIYKSFYRRGRFLMPDDIATIYPFLPIKYFSESTVAAYIQFFGSGTSADGFRLHPPYSVPVLRMYYDDLTKPTLSTVRGDFSIKIDDYIRMDLSTFITGCGMTISVFNDNAYYTAYYAGTIYQSITGSGMLGSSNDISYFTTNSYIDLPSVKELNKYVSAKIELSAATKYFAPDADMYFKTIAQTEFVLDHEEKDEFGSLTARVFEKKYLNYIPLAQGLAKLKIIKTITEITAEEKYTFVGLTESDDMLFSTAMAGERSFWSLPTTEGCYSDHFKMKPEFVDHDVDRIIITETLGCNFGDKIGMVYAHRIAKYNESDSFEKIQDDIVLIQNGIDTKEQRISLGVIERYYDEQFMPVIDKKYGWTPLWRTEKDEEILLPLNNNSSIIDGYVLFGSNFNSNIANILFITQTTTGDITFIRADNSLSLKDAKVYKCKLTRDMEHPDIYVLSEGVIIDEYIIQKVSKDKIYCLSNNTEKIFDISRDYKFLHNCCPIMNQIRSKLSDFSSVAYNETPEFFDTFKPVGDPAFEPGGEYSAVVVHAPESVTYNRVGSFKNDLLQCYSVDDPQIQYTNNNVISYPLHKNLIQLALELSGNDYMKKYPDAEWTREQRKIMHNIGINMNAADNPAGDIETPDLFKFTYFKYVDSASNINTNGFLLPVKFDMKEIIGETDNKYKTGFWYQNLNNSAKIDGYKDFTYDCGLFNIGMTLDETHIMDKNHLNAPDLKVDTGSISASGFSADDFEGIYISTSNAEPVMYIDVGMGECSEGTSWSLSGYKSKDDNSYGLILELD